MSNKNITYNICKEGLWDSTVPDISFDENGTSNFSYIQHKLIDSFPRGEKGLKDWSNIVDKVKVRGKGKNYDCIVGVSGGVDSSYLLYILKEKYEINPLAVTLDNGWSSEIASRNIKLMTDALDIDLETHVIDYEEIKDLIRSYMFAAIPWIDTPTDTAIKGLMYKTALKENIKYIFRGNDFRTEGKQPREWTYSDHRQLKYIHKKFGRISKLKTYPYLPYWKIIYSNVFKGIRDIRPYYYIEYSKDEAKSLLETKFGWRYYGGHHHENIFTKFVMSYWLPKKFNIDKRIISLSAQIVSGLLEREKGLKLLKTNQITDQEGQELIKYVSKKLDFSKEEFDKILSSNNKTYKDYPNYEFFLRFVIRFMRPFISILYDQKPMTFVEMENNKRS